MSVPRGRCWRGLVEWVEWWRPAERSRSRSQASADDEGASGSERSADGLHWLRSFESGYAQPASESTLLDPRMDSWVNDGESTEAELAEFLACDLEATEADPRFREELREQLWALVEQGELLRRRDH